MEIIYGLQPATTTTTTTCSLKSILMAFEIAKCTLSLKGWTAVHILELQGTTHLFATQREFEKERESR